MVLLRYGVTYLIQHPPPPNADSHYLELDTHVVLAMYATLTDQIIDHVIGATTTYALWTRIQDYFLANRAARYMILNRQYRNLKQGDLSVDEYARRMKLLTAGLADIDHAVTEVDLTTQFLHGLDGRFDTIRVTVFSRVKLAEENQAQRASDTSATVLAVHGSGGTPETGGSSGPSCFPNNGGSGPRSGERADRSSDRGSNLQHGRGNGPSRQGDGGERGRGRGHGRGDSGGRGHALPAYNPYMGFFAPYGMAIPPPRPVWVPSNSAGVLGPRPGSHAHAYPVQYSPYHAPSPHQPPSWDHLAMLHAAYSSHGFSNPGPSSNEWYLDSGASNHVTGNSGPLHTESHPDLR
nr:uncharacterized protein LOC109767880 [Aegilops tauschii subsp. strangulata]